MKKKTTLELIEQSEKVSLYSISFAVDHTTEFERFLEKFESEASWNRDYQRVLYAISIILGNGALERYFRPEGSMNDDLCQEHRHLRRRPEVVRVRTGPAKIRQTAPPGH